MSDSGIKEVKPSGSETDSSECIGKSGSECVGNSASECAETVGDRKLQPGDSTGLTANGCLTPLPVLNLPAVPLKIKVCADGIRRVYDPLRQKFVALTPEEWVRQHFTAFLIQHLGYPQELMANEVSLKFNGQSRRCDTVLFSHRGFRPRVIMEYKAPGIEITQKVFDQIARYNLVMGAQLLIVSNGMRHYCCASAEGGTYRFLPEIPCYEDLPPM